MAQARKRLRIRRSIVGSQSPQLFEPLIAMLTGLNPNADPILSNKVRAARSGEVKLPLPAFAGAAESHKGVYNA